MLPWTSCLFIQRPVVLLPPGEISEERTDAFSTACGNALDRRPRLAGKLRNTTFQGQCSGNSPGHTQPKDLEAISLLQTMLTLIQFCQSIQPCVHVVHGRSRGRQAEDPDQISARSSLRQVIEEVQMNNRNMKRRERA